MIAVYILVVVLGMFILYKNRQQKRSSKPLPPGPAGWPLIGSALEINDENIFSKFDEMVLKYGDIFSVNILNERVVSVNSEALINDMFCSEQFKKLTNNRGIIYFGEHFYFGSQSVAFYPDGYSSVYSKMRTGIHKWLNWYGNEARGHLEKNVLAELDNLNRKIECIGNGDVDISALMRRSISNTISLALSGEGIPDGDPDVNIFWDFVDGNNFFVAPKINFVMRTFPFLRFIPGTYKEMYHHLASSVARLTRKYVTDHQKTMVRGQIRGLVDALTEDQRRDLEAGVEPTFTNERIISNMLETVAAGILTTWSMLTSTFLCLLHHEEYQERAYMELMDAIGPDRDATVGDKQHCPFLVAIGMEALRLITPVPLLLARQSTQDFEFHGYNIPEKSELIANAWHIHHSEKIWGDPWTFRPERFLDETGQLLPMAHDARKNWMPFGVGRRSCTGESLAKSRYFHYLASLLKKWKFIPIFGRYGSYDPRDLDDFDIKGTVRPKPFFCKVEKRQM